MVYLIYRPPFQYSLSRVIFGADLAQVRAPSECDPSLNDQGTNADLPVLPAWVIASNNCPHTCPKRTHAVSHVTSRIFGTMNDFC